MAKRPSKPKESDIRKVLTELLTGIDDDALDYFQSMITDAESIDEDGLQENLAPFVESYGLASDLSEANKICSELCVRLRGMGMEDSAGGGTGGNGGGGEQSLLLEKSIMLSDITNCQISESEQATIDTLWGFDSIRNKRNATIEMTEAGSARYERKAVKDQRKWLAELESRFQGDEDEDGTQISTMTLPDLSGNNREKDIHVSNFTITYGGQILLDEADLRLVYGRRYGLIGRNGIGKTTLLKHMANFDIEGISIFFPYLLSIYLPIYHNYLI